MRITALERYGLPHHLVRRWLDDGLRFLLPIQSEAVTSFGLLDGKSLIVNGPGTSGKTFCGELAALSQVAKRRKAIFLVPLKAIAEEKYLTFHRRYSPLGLRVRLSTRDQHGSDRDIHSGKFDIAIMIYEKFNILSATDAAIVNNSSTFVLDEFQLISDPRRGLEMELVIMKIRAFNPQAQLVVLMGGGSSSGMVARWLGIPVLEENRRPIDLRLGVLRRGTFRFRGFNDLKEGEEQWLERLEPDTGGPLDAQSLAAIKYLAGIGEQTIAFTRSKRTAEGMALHLASHLDLPPARESLKSLQESPPSLQNGLLERCLHKGVAFHHAELEAYQRRVVEDGFRKGEIKVLSSTSTLAWGVNLPAKNVFIETVRCSGKNWRHRSWQVVPLSGMDFHQAAGRAGRLGSGQKFGRAVMIATTPYEEEVLWETYVYGQSQAPASSLSESDLPDIVMRMVSSGVASDPEKIASACKNSYAACCAHWSSDILGKTDKTLIYLEKGGLINLRSWGKIETTPLGRAAASSNLSVESSIKVAEKALSLKDADPLEWLVVGLGLREWQEGASLQRTARMAEPRLISARLEDLAGRAIIDKLGLPERADAPHHETWPWPVIGGLLFALEWISGEPTPQMEAEFGKGAGGLRRDAATLSWIIRGINRLLEALNVGTGDQSLLSESLSLLAERLTYGVDEKMVPVARVLNIDREFIRRIYQAGITSVDDLFDIDFSTLASILPSGILKRVDGWRKRFSKGEQPPLPAKRPAPAIVFTGRTRKLLKEAEIYGRSVFLQPKLLAYLQKLWWAFADGKPWVHKEALEPGLNQSKYISKLRRQLETNDTGIKIGCDGRGFYRLVLPEGDEFPGVIGDNDHIGVDQRGGTYGA